MAANAVNPKMTMTSEAVGEKEGVVDLMSMMIMNFLVQIAKLLTSYGWEDHASIC
jgi:hypothetical protein